MTTRTLLIYPCAPFPAATVIACASKSCPYQEWFFLAQRKLRISMQKLLHRHRRHHGLTCVCEAACLSVGFDLDLAVLGPFIAFRCLLSQGAYLLSGRAITQRHQASDSTFIRVTPRLFSRHLHMRLIGQIIRHSDCRVDASAVSWLESGAALLGSFQIAQSRRNRL